MLEDDSSFVTNSLTNFLLVPLQSKQYNDLSPLMRALDPRERETFEKKLPDESAILKLVETRNRNRIEYAELKKIWPKETFMAQLEEKRNEIQSRAQRIADLKKQQTENCN